MSTDNPHSEPQPAENAAATDPDGGHGGHDSHDSHGGHDDHAVPADAIPVNSPQDMVLKLITIVGAILVCGSFGWWWTLPLPQVAEGHGGAEVEHH